MKSDVIMIDNQGYGFHEAVEQIRKVAEFKRMDKQNSLYLQLCAEEMLSLVRSVTGEMKASFWVECTDEQFDLHMTTKTVLDKDKRAQLIASSTTKTNEAARSFLGRLRNALEQALASETDYQYYDLPDEIAADISGRAIEDPEWDGYERSVLRKIADDIKIGIRGGTVEMTVSKRIAQ